MDLNELWAIIQPYVVMLADAGVDGVIVYFLAKLITNKWFKKQDVDNLLNGFATRLTGSEINIDVTAVTEKKLEQIEKGLFKKSDEQQTQFDEVKTILVDIADIFASGKTVSPEQRNRLIEHTAKIRTKEPAPPKQIIKVKLEPVKLPNIEKIENITNGISMG